MILSATTQSIEIAKAASTTTTSPEVYVSYVDITTTTFTPGVQRSTLSGGAGADTTVVSAPAASTQRQVKYMTIFNRDTVTHTFTVQHDLSGTDFFIAQIMLLANEMAEYVYEKGWTIHDTSGFIKENMGVGVTSIVASGGTISSGAASFANSNGVSFGINGQSLTAVAVPNMNSSLWANIYAHGTTMSTLGATVNGSMMVFPLNPNGDLRFPGVMTVSSMYLGMSGSQTATSATSSNASFTYSFGLYTLNGSTLSLLNSGSASFNLGSGSDATSGLHGPRFLNVPTSAWSAALTLSNDIYYMGIVMATSSQNRSVIYLGWRFMNSNQWSGFLGSATSSATSRGMFPFSGVMTTAGIPATIQQSQLNKANASAGFVPYMVFNNFSSQL